jgi:hypothetical protein
LDLATKRPRRIRVVLDRGGGLVDLGGSNGPNGSRYEHHCGDRGDQPLVLPKGVYDLAKVELRLLWRISVFSAFSDGAPPMISVLDLGQRVKGWRAFRALPGVPSRAAPPGRTRDRQVGGCRGFGRCDGRRRAVPI